MALAGHVRAVGLSVAAAEHVARVRQERSGALALASSFGDRDRGRCIAAGAQQIVRDDARGHMGRALVVVLDDGSTRPL